MKPNYVCLMWSSRKNGEKPRDMGSILQLTVACSKNVPFEVRRGGTKMMALVP